MGQFQNFQEFYKFYLKEHSQPATRIVHVLGTALGLLLFLPASIVFRRPDFIVYGLVFTYSLLFLSHFIIEKNKPATLKNPLWSFMADFKMLYETITGKVPLNKTL